MQLQSLLRTAYPSRMLPPFQRFQVGAVALVCCIVVACFGYHFFGGYSWIESLWVVVIAISTVGFGERSSLTPAMQLFTVGVVISGVTAAAYTFSAFMQSAIEGELQRLVGNRKMTREIDQLEGHTIVCGYGRTGEMVAKDFRAKQLDFVIVDNAGERIDEARNDGCLIIEGDATEEATLMSAGLDRANALLTCLPSDAENVFITLTARNLNSTIRIVSRAEQPTTEKKLIQAGANRVVLPVVSGAMLMSRVVMRPSTADFVELVSARDFSDLELDELLIAPGSSLIGMTVRDTEAGRVHRLLVVAVKPAAGQMVFNPDADYTFAESDTVILIGHENDIDRFRSEHRMHDNA